MFARLRELALESIHGNRASPERITAAQSGRALELLNQGLIWLADQLRISYGEAGLLQLARLIVRASQMYSIVVFGAADRTVGSKCAAKPQVAKMVSHDRGRPPEGCSVVDVPGDSRMH